MVHRSLPLTALFQLAATLVCAGSAEAAFTRYISTVGTSSGPGNVSITIETFSKPDWPGSTGPLATAMPIYNISVPIPNASTAVQTTSAIRDSVDAKLGVDYVVTIVSSTFVKIDRVASGNFTMSIVNNVPGQSIFESCAPSTGCIVGAPALSLPETAGLALICAAACLLVLTRRGRPGESGT